MFKSLIKKILGAYGYEISRMQKFHVNAFEDQRKLLSKIDVDLILDLGAHAGQTIKKYRDIFPNAVIHSFEPSPGSFRYLVENYGFQEKTYLHQLAISNQQGSSNLYVNQNDSNATNSLLSLSDNYSEYLDLGIDSSSILNVKLDTLNNFCANHEISRVQILKMDIQGSELLALQGCTNLLSRQAIDLIYIEVLFTNLYKSQCYFDEIASFLRQYHYRLYGFYEPWYTKKGLLLQADVIFISSTFEESLKSEDYKFFV